MAHTISTYEAKSRFSDVIRRVRAGQRVIITYRGKEVAEMRPIEPAAERLDERIAELEVTGVLKRSGRRFAPRTVGRHPGALERFLEDRE